jgi:hypothetical protein
MDEPHNHADILPREPSTVMQLLHALVGEFAKNFCKSTPALAELVQPNHADIVPHGPSPHGPSTREQLLALVEKFLNDLHELRLSLPDDLQCNHDDIFPPSQFTREQLQALAEKFKKNRLELTPALANDLQRAANEFSHQRWLYNNISRLSEEKKRYEAFRDLFAELTKQFRSWEDPESRLHFIHRITDPYFQDGKALDEGFHDLAELTKQFRR